MAGGCSTNISNSKILTALFELSSTILRCAVHAADGSIKRLTKSEKNMRS